MNPNRTVTIVRRLRDGSETSENVPAWLAEQIVGAIVVAEPNTASARIVEIVDTPYPTKRLRQDWRSVALFLSGEFGRATGTIH